MNPQPVTIVPPTPQGDGISLAMGTRVLLQDGTELGAVTSIELTAKVGDLWRAQIQCFPRMNGPIHALATVYTAKPLRWWRRWLLRLAAQR